MPADLLQIKMRVQQNAQQLKPGSKLSADLAREFQKTLRRTSKNLVADIKDGADV